ncbi:MAG: phosphoglucosamine mutase, partial [Planctomycetaceae bacterium]
EANVVAKMCEVSAELGGEGNGGVIEPRVGWVRDSFMGIAYVLEGLARRNARLSDWVAELPAYCIVKDKLTCARDRVGPACAALKAAFPEAAANDDDGLRLDWPDRWVQARASNTEPIVRVIAEAPDEPAARELCAQAMQLVRDSVTP